MLADFYGAIDDALNVPEDHRFFPSIYDIDALDQKIAELGGVDTVYAGLGYKAWWRSANARILLITA
jgi:glucosamine-6-phosphate deaminase